MVIRVIVLILFPLLGLSQAGMLTTPHFFGISDGDLTTMTAGSNTNSYTQLGVTSDTVWAVTSDSMLSYNHHPHLCQSGSGKIYLIFSTHSQDEEGVGEFSRYSYSSDNGATWATPDTLFPPQDTPAGRNVDGRVVVTAGFAVFGDSLFAVGDINEREWATNSGNRVGIGMLAAWIDTTADTVGTPFWFVNVDGSGTAPSAISGFDSYSFSSYHNNTFLVDYYSPEKIWAWAFSLPDDELWYSRESTYTGAFTNSEPAAGQLPDGTYMKLWRDIDSGDQVKYAQFSNDGYVWKQGPVQTAIPEAGNASGSRADVLTLPAATYIIGNGPPNTARSPLVIWKSNNGYDYPNGYKIVSSTDAPSFGGTGKSAGVQYPDCIELANGQILCAYSIAKEHIAVSRFNAP